MLPFDGIYGWLLRYPLSNRSQVWISSFGVNHKNDFESATNVCENFLSGSKYNLLGTSKAMARDSSAEGTGQKGVSNFTKTYVPN